MPETVWFPNVAAAAQSYLKQSTWYGLADKQLYDLSTVKYMYCASGGNTTLYLRASGPDHANLYGAGSGEMLEHDNLHRIAK
jgi:hypothetical protein